MGDANLAGAPTPSVTDCAHEDVETTTYDDLAHGRRLYLCVQCGRERIEPSDYREDRRG